MIKRPFATIALATVLMSPVSDASHGVQTRTGVAKAGSGPIICRVMEAFDEGKLGVRAIVFHQRDKADGPRLGSLLLARSGQDIVLETGGSQRYRATVFRVKSCFGRGLVLIPASRMKLGNNDDFTLRLPAENGPK